MRIAITGPSGSGKTTLATEISRTVGLRRIELDALHHGPNWESCGAEALGERALVATDGDGWVTDSTYHGMLGNLVSDRADILVWLDLPIPLVMWRLLRRTNVRNRDTIELWNGNLEPGWRESARYLIWPALRRAFANRREFPARYAHLRVERLRSDDDVRAFVQSIRSAESSRSGACSAQQ
jgi:adenylate kinase family enzyme